MKLKYEFDIYKFEGEVFAIKEGAGWAYWFIDLQDPNTAYSIKTELGDSLCVIVQKYYKKVRREAKTIMSSDLVWLCRKELEFDRRFYI